MKWVAVATREELSTRRAMLVWLADDWPVAVIEVGNEVCVVDARCTHQEAWLHEGLVDVIACELTCPLHDARFSLRTGQATHGPAAAPLTVYPTRQDDDGTLWVQMVDVWWR